jgi:transcriptional regulator with GAF, ATPase, and Fis domain
MLAGTVRVREFPAKRVSHFADTPVASTLERIVGCSEELRHVLGHVRKVAATDATVLITG